MCHADARHGLSQMLHAVAGTPMHFKTMRGIGVTFSHVGATSKHSQVSVNAAAAGTAIFEIRTTAILSNS